MIFGKNQFLKAKATAILYNQPSFLGRKLNISLRGITVYCLMYCCHRLRIYYYYPNNFIEWYFHFGFSLFSSLIDESWIVHQDGLAFRLTDINLRLLHIHPFFPLLLRVSRLHVNSLIQKHDGKAYNTLFHLFRHLFRQNIEAKVSI